MMPGAQNLSVTMIRHVAEHLGDLLEQVVFLGGAVTGLLLTDPAAPEARFTKDVDVVVSAGSYPEYARLEQALHDLGFTNVSDVICRWNIAGVIVDFMPPNEAILGFSNRWYHRASETATRYEIEKGLSIRLITAPYFVATKLQAFLDPEREGSGDYLFSRDISDIITLIDGRQEIISEILISDLYLRGFISQTFKAMLLDTNFRETLSGHFLPDDASQKRLPLIVQRLEKIAEPT